MFNFVVRFFIAAGLMVFYTQNIQASQDFWKIQRKGANVFNVNVSKTLLSRAKDNKISFVRLSIDKFQTKRKDFLIGDCDNYVSLDENDLKNLKIVLDRFRRIKIPVVITMLSLPGARWAQKNGGLNDFRMYRDEKFKQSAISFWRDLALALYDYRDIIVGYNLLNEPRFERFDEIENCSATHQNKLFEIYRQIITEIRKIDHNMKIILDVSSDASPECFQFLTPINDDNVIYSFHMYQPFAFTMSSAKWNKDRGKYTMYPVKIDNILWDKIALNNHLNVVSKWQKKYHIPSSSILVGEFGANRMNRGVDMYFRDLIEIFDQNKWHWAFYAFEEDTWNNMDYEIGRNKMNAIYWEKYEKCNKNAFQSHECHDLNLPYYNINSVFSILRNALNKN